MLLVKTWFALALSVVLCRAKEKARKEGASDVSLYDLHQGSLDLLRPPDFLPFASEGSVGDLPFLAREENN